MTAATTQGDPIAEAQLVALRARLRAPLRGRERTTQLTWLAAFLAAASVLALHASGAVAPAQVVVALLLALALASRLDFEVGPIVAYPTELVLVPLLFALPSGLVPLAVAGALVVAQADGFLRRRIAPERIAVTIGNASYAFAPALVFLAAGRSGSPGRLAVVVGLALVAQFALDAATAVVRNWLALRVPPRRLLQPLLWAFALDALLAPIGLAGALAGREGWAGSLLPLPVLGLIAIFAGDRRGRRDQELELSTAYRGTAFLLGDVIEADDAYTGSHSRHVVEFVVSVAARLGLDSREARLAEFTALLHDVGKIKMPAEIINKPGPLSAAERAVIETHTVEGEALLRQVGGMLAEVGALVRSCHERWDGTGYPDRLRGGEIPLVSRIVACCDALDAMESDRPYRPALTRAEAVAELVAGRGSQFDPQVVDALLAVVETAGQQVRVDVR